MLKTLYAKLLVVLIGLTIIMAVIFLVVIRYSDVARNQEINQRLYRNLAARMIEQQILSARDPADPGAVQAIFDRIRLVNPRIDVYLVDSTGRVITASVQNGLKRDRVDVEPIRRFLDVNAKLPIRGDDPSDAERQRVFSAAPVPLPNSAQGYLYIVMRGFSGDSLAQRIKQSYVLRETLWLVGAGLAIALLASMLIILLITRPLRRLSGAMDQFRRSGFEKHPEPLRAARDEIGTLTDTFNGMAERIVSQMNALRRTDTVRRELVANISHDLRTPLALLQGYLETLQLKRATLSEEEQRNYLETALKQTEQLGSLVARLFDLAKLDSGQMAINREAFALQDLVQDVMQDFELAAAAKGVALKSSLHTDLPLVLGDIGLLERVLRNLIENALRYTGASGSVTISAYPEDGHAVLQVADTGAGIAPEELPRIFERFYRVDKSRSADTGHSGLGLAIAKGILDLHASPISVESRPGHTAFRFTLAFAATPQRALSAAAPAGVADAERRAPSLAYPAANLP